MFQITDFDVAPGVIDTDYISPAEILVGPINEIEQVGMIRCCSCGNVIGGSATRVYKNLQDKINNYRHSTRSNPSEELHAQFFREAQAAEPSIANLCCTNLIESRPRIAEPPDTYILRHIDGQELLNSDNKYLARRGNIILETFDHQEYNPYSYSINKLNSSISDLQLLEDLEIQEISKEYRIPKKPKTFGVLEKYPIMPEITPADGFVLESLDLFSSVRGKYIVYGTAHTGLKGFEVPVTRATSVIAR